MGLRARCPPGDACHPEASGVRAVSDALLLLTIAVTFTWVIAILLEEP